MSKPSPRKPDGKPTNRPENVVEKVGQREPPQSGDDRGKPSLEPHKRDATLDRDGTLSDDHEVE